ncbi:pyridoxal phosphate-dependent aminotransferase [Bradyrhizobium sp. SZCCHNR3015]|uniref:pyridoxal phosphate-dependent aminotransferase n=1 Tax=Bradyrhizobium sp. SZCCHNR3015 TaxID=3057395 RepID=UPI002915FA5B|nr:pyridoxal phosphate-dependent aminotransferase [Bradyrhizobium sp. SZCCHNR3015]
MARSLTFVEHLREVIGAEAPGYVTRGPARTAGSTHIADIDMSVGEARFNWPDDLLKSLVRPSSSQMWYQDPRGSADLRTAILVDSEQGPMPVDKIDIGNVLITSGAKQALWLAFLISVKAGDNVLLPRPGWSPYAIWAKMLGAEVCWYDSSETSAETAIRKIRSGSVSHVVINSPNNPTGVEFEQPVIDDIAASARGAGVVVISDEVYRCFAANGGTFLPHVDKRCQLVMVADSLSKSAGAAGLRVGFLIGGHDTIDAAVAIRGTVDSCPPGIGQSAGSFLLSQSTRHFRNGVRRLARSTVNRLVEVLTMESVPVESSGGLYVWIRSDSPDGRVAISNRRILRGVPGAAFGKAGYVRFCPVTDHTSCAALLGLNVSLSVAAP